MNKYVLVIVVLCFFKLINCANVQDGTKTKNMEEVTETTKWTDEDLQKAKEIIQYFNKQNDEEDENDNPPLLGTNKPSHKHTSNDERDSAIDSWSIVWYVASFGGLIVFFLVVSCSEWCCRRRDQNAQASQIPTLPPQIGISSSIIESPPPAYELFAPPSYESCNENNEKDLFDIFVVPVHAIRPIIEEDPPQYATINIQDNHLSTHSHA